MPHRRQQDVARGSRTQRGYGAAHKAARARWRLAIDAGQLVTCWRCGEVIRLGQRWHLGHDDDRTVTRGPEHELCNLSAAGHASHRR